MDHHQIGDPRAQSVYDTAGPHVRGASHRLSLRLPSDEGSPAICLSGAALVRRQRQSIVTLIQVGCSNSVLWISARLRRLVFLHAAPPFHADEGALKELRETFGYGEGFLTICLAYCNNDAQQVRPSSAGPCPGFLAKAFSGSCAAHEAFMTLQPSICHSGRFQCILDTVLCSCRPV